MIKLMHRFLHTKEKSLQLEIIAEAACDASSIQRRGVFPHRRTSATKWLVTKERSLSSPTSFNS